MTAAPRAGGWVIALSFVAAFLLGGIPWPGGLERFRPDWAAMVLIYWTMALPHRVGLGTGWLVGLLLDVGRGALLGQHALAFAAVAYLTSQTYRRIRAAPLWQQTFSILLFLLVKQILVFWISGVIGYPPKNWWYLAPALGGMACWPLLFVILRDVRRYFEIS
ncbi:MAG TPA: rod shape-determining protein MreD [Gammaproteobacteria bacterium]|mgnify:CR=1 FL=1|nr:rod shape-determining protein MreD [Candidatus Competibacteraceae bacterium]HAO32272.1 rod shape-determining protein MreD [Candidatus Competibacteraceae bacterium]HCB14605.1 rod shape-determining protein MreD [Gammaproteobacteria bacterium]HRE55551.1 rod shape-determining protein MreD [Candidatus Competibacter sp.]HUM94932.1 rod shape-determining protein MreD [Candidatus Competibacter sp.]